LPISRVNYSYFQNFQKVSLRLLYRLLLICANM